MTVSSKYSRFNKKRPVLAVRAPTAAHYRRVQKAAEVEGLTLSQWVRLAIAERLHDAGEPHDRRG